MSVFAAEAKKIDDLKKLYPSYPVTYTFNINNKSANDVSLFLIKFVHNSKTDKDGWLTYKEDGSTKKMAKIKKF